MIGCKRAESELAGTVEERVQSRRHPKRQLEASRYGRAALRFATLLQRLLCMCWCMQLPHLIESQVGVYFPISGLNHCACSYPFAPFPALSLSRSYPNPTQTIMHAWRSETRSAAAGKARLIRGERQRVIRGQQASAATRASASGDRRASSRCG